MPNKTLKKIQKWVEGRKIEEDDYSVKPVDSLICGDSLKILKSLPSGIFDLVVTSPPYFNQRKYTT